MPLSCLAVGGGGSVVGSLVPGVLAGAPACCCCVSLWVVVALPFEFDVCVLDVCRRWLLLVPSALCDVSFHHLWVVLTPSHLGGLGFALLSLLMAAILGLPPLCAGPHEL